MTRRLAVLFPVALLVAACGSEASSDPAGESSVPSETTVTTTAESDESSPTTHEEEPERLPAIDEDSAM